MDLSREELKEYLKQEESHAFKGWNFSYLNNRWDGGEKLPWDYKEILLKYIKKTDYLLDMGTGGGEFLLTINHSYSLTYITEGYTPNIELCKKQLEPLGITVKTVYEDDIIPYASNMFDIVINRLTWNILELNKCCIELYSFIYLVFIGTQDNDILEFIWRN